ncbi:MAG: DDE-type integrase/transposase/recombinase [Verrucomicrobia bacterium]|nr:DDE-type integrase/transposase/recombinase [Verrucomicrobiota bacterium]
MPTKKGFVYLAVILDLYSRKVVGSCVLEHMEHSLVLQALSQALKRYGSEKEMIFTQIEEVNILHGQSKRC